MQAQQEWRILLTSILNDFRIESDPNSYPSRRITGTSIYFGATRVHICFQYLVSIGGRQSESNYFSMKEFLLEGNYVLTMLGLKSSSLPLHDDSPIALMDLFRIFDKQETGKITIENFVLGVLDTLFSFRNNGDEIKNFASVSIVSKVQSVGSPTRQKNSILLENDDISSFRVDTLLAVLLDPSNNLSTLYLFFLINRLEALRNGEVQQDPNDIRMSRYISLQSLVSTIQSAVDDAIITISQYFHIPNIRLNCILENQPGESRQESIIELNGKKGQRTFVWIVDKLKGHSKSSSVEFPLIHNDLENSFEQSRESAAASNSDPDTKPFLSDETLLLLQTAFKSLESFGTVSELDNLRAVSLTNHSDNNTDVNKFETESPVSDSITMRQLLTTQEELRRTKTRLEVLEILLDRDKSIRKSIDVASINSLEGTGDYDDKCAVYDKILSEIDLLKASAAERATKSHPLGFLSEGGHNKQVAIISTAFSNMTEDGDGRSSLTSQESEELSHKIAPFLEKLQKVAGSVLENAALFQRQQQQLVAATSALQQQEEKMKELRSVVEQSEVDRSEALYMRVEVQLLRETNVKLRNDLERLNNLQMEFDKLERLNRQLTEQKRGQNQREEHSLSSSSSSSSASSSSGSSNKKSSNDQKEVIHQLEAKLAASKSEISKLEKDNLRLKNAMLVSEQRVKDCLHDQMLLQHQVQSLEEEVLAGKASITRLTREIEEKKFQRGGREDKEKRLGELQREIAKLQHELEVQKEAVRNTAKLQAELANAEKTVESLENKLGDMSIEVERGAVALSQLENYREQIRLKTKETRDLQLHAQGLVAQLKNVPYLQSKLQEQSDELQDYSLRVEKIPGLLAEIARMRGSSRASLKALADQDKTLAASKQKIKQLEKENAVLKNENRLIQDMDMRLKDALAEIKRLKAMEDEVNSLKTAVQNTNVEKKALEGENKKMRKFMRQSVISPGGLNMNSIATVSNSNNGIVAVDLNAEDSAASALNAVLHFDNDT